MPTRVGLPMALALALFLSGPRVALNEEVDAVEVPVDVEAWLEERERDVPNLRGPDEVKTVVWADTVVRGRTPVALVYFHGFSADRHELDPVPQRVAEELGANLFLTRLAGHARDGAAMGEVSGTDWLQDAVEAVAVGRRLGERVILMGTSTGATLALWTAARVGLREDLAGMVLLSPNLGLADPNARLLLLPWGGHLARVALGAERCFEVLDEDHARHWTTCYPTRALLPMMGLVERVRTLDLSEVNVPTIILYSPDDRVVDAIQTERYFEEIGGDPKALVAVEGIEDPQSHLVAGDLMSPSTNEAVVEEVVDFLRPLIHGGR